MNHQRALKHLENKWRKVYWFARMLINTDKYGGIGTDSKLIAHIASTLRVLASENTSLEKKELLKLQKCTIKNILETRFQKAASKRERIKNLIADIDKEILDMQDIDIFIDTCELIMLPINNAIKNIPNNDKEYTESLAKKYLDVQGEQGLASVINLWDDLGVKGCLTAEREVIIHTFGNLRQILARKANLSETDHDIILTAFAQEFERRAGQKRKGRAGGSVEDVTSFILNYFNISTIHPPEHFQADIEVDKWIQSKDGWCIGISCKRTIRERWKQVSSGDSNILSKFKIKYLCHVITYDEDLSDDKIALLGGQRHRFYLRDDSRIYKYASTHVGLKDYVHPMSQFIMDIKKEQE